MLGVSNDIDECAGGLTPQFTLFLFYKIVSPSESMRKNKERFFILKYKPILNDLKLTLNSSRVLRITIAIIIIVILQ